jgi:tetratricopeptide (TPR) repeat protein
MRFFDMGKKIKEFLLVLFSVSLLVFFNVSCGSKNEKGHPLFIKARHLENNGEYREAVKIYEKYLKVNPSSDVTHYKLAELYNDNIDEPFYAIYHFKEFLKLQPDFPDRESVQAWIDAAEKKMAERIRERDPASVSQEEIAKLKEYNEKYRSYLLKLKDQNAALRKRLSNSVQVGVSEKQAKGESGGKCRSVSDKKGSVLFDSSGEPVILRTYKVKAGDSLSRISREVYGSSRYYKVIFEANRSTMPTEASLKIGQELKIPKLEGKK